MITIGPLANGLDNRNTHPESNQFGAEEVLAALRTLSGMTASPALRECLRDALLDIAHLAATGDGWQGIADRIDDDDDDLYADEEDDDDGD